MKHKGFAQAVFGPMVVAAMVLSTLAPVGAAPTQTTVTLTPVADATVDILSPNTNFGHEHTLGAQYLSSHQMRRALIRFNLAASVPPDAIIELARLELFLESSEGPVSINLIAACLTEDWVESNVTWNNRPVTGSPTVATLVDTSVSPVRVDVTDIVRAWHNVPHYGLELAGPEGDTFYDLVFESREHGERPPQLVVTYRLPTILTEGWCCLNGEVFSATEAECLESGGHFFATQEEAEDYCRGEMPPEGWCCLNGEVFPSTEAECLESGGHFFATQEEAEDYCRGEVPPEGWCCLNGEVFPSTEAECLEGGGHFFATQEEAEDYCRGEVPPEGWCCLNGEVFPSTEAECLERGGYFFATQEEAEDYCRGDIPEQLPDLVVIASERGAIIPSPPITDRPTVLEVLVENIGNVPVDRSFTIELYVDGKREWTWTFLPILEEEDPEHQYNPLMPGGTRIYDCEKTFQEGEHSLRWVVDVGNEIKESDEANNELKITANWQPPPDLIVEDVWPVGAPAGGQKSTWKVKIKNIGKGDASIPFLTTFWPEGVAGGAQENFWTQSLPAGQSATFQTTQSFRSWGKLKLTVTVDASYAVTEALPDGENNNELVKQFDLAFVDLKVENLVIKPTKLSAYEDTDFSFIIKNIGSADALQPFKVKLLPGKVTQGLTQPILLTVKELKSGQSVNLQHSVKLLPGDCQVSIEADYPDPDVVYFEPDRNNNVLVESIHVYAKKEAFLISDQNWKDVLRLVSLTTWSDPKLKEQVDKHPTLIFHLEPDDAFDADAVVHFLQQYTPSHLSIFGNTRASQIPILPIPGVNPQTLESLLVAKKPTGAGLQAGQISKYDMDSYLYFWASIDKVVISEDDYETGLMASVLASYLNAPLLFDDEQFDPTVLNNRYAYVVGKVWPTMEQEINNRCKMTSEKTHYSLEELRKAYVGWTGTDKLILVNPADLNITSNKQFKPDKSPTISTIYGKHSLAAPFLAAAKHEIIISTEANTYLGVDAFVEDTLDSLKLPGSLTYLTIVANPRAIPIARENRSTFPALWGDKVVFEEIDPSKIDSQPLGLSVVTFSSTGGTGSETIVTTRAGDLSPAIYKDTVVWWQSRNNNYDIYLYDLTNKTEKQVTNDAHIQKYPAIYGDKIVWQDNRNTYKDKDGNQKQHWDIYMYDIKAGTQTRITTDTHDQVNPAICGNKIVWEDKRNNNQWDIYMYDLNTKKEIRITTDGHAQLHPAIDGNVIVWQDKRNSGQWDIYMYDLGQKKEVRITTESEHQVHPSVSGNRIVWADRRHGNSCVYIYDITTKTETQLTTGGNKQIRPVIQGDHVIWYSEGRTSIPPVHVAPPWGARGGIWRTYFYEISTGKLMSYQNLLTHEYSTFRQETDGRYYGSLVNYGKQDRAVGRIFGVSTSDVSAYIARDLFFEDIKPQKKDALLIVREDHQSETKHKEIDGTSLYNYAVTTYWTTDVSNEFDTVYFYAGADNGAAKAPAVNKNLATIRALYEDCYLILYSDHGGGAGFSDGPHPVVTSNYLNNKYLLPSTILNIACATCTASWGYEPPDNIFCMENIRRGAMVYMGAVDISYWHRMFDNILEGAFVKGKTIGQVYVEARNEEYSNCSADLTPWPCGDTYYALIGDPTFKPRWW